MSSSECKVTIGPHPSRVVRRNPTTGDVMYGSDNEPIMDEGLPSQGGVYFDGACCGYFDRRLAKEGTAKVVLTTCDIARTWPTWAIGLIQKSFASEFGYTPSIVEPGGMVTVATDETTGVQTVVVDDPLLDDEGDDDDTEIEA